MNDTAKLNQVPRGHICYVNPLTSYPTHTHTHTHTHARAHQCCLTQFNNAYFWLKKNRKVIIPIVLHVQVHALFHSLCGLPALP